MEIKRDPNFRESLIGKNVKLLLGTRYVIGPGEPYRRVLGEIIVSGIFILKFKTTKCNFSI